MFIAEFLIIKILDIFYENEIKRLIFVNENKGFYGFPAKTIRLTIFVM